MVDGNLIAEVSSDLETWRPALLPEPIQRFTTKGVYDDEHEHLSFIQGGGAAVHIPIWSTNFS